MANNPETRFRSINPKLTTNYSIYTSLILSLFLLLTIFEQLGIPQQTLTYTSIFIPIAIIAIIGIASTTNDANDFYVSGRRVPSVYNGLAITAAAIGSSGLVGFIGCIFFLGYDAMAFGIGWVIGLLLMTILFAPYLRKMGAYTLPSFFAKRYESNLVRIVCIITIIIPITIILLAEIRIAVFALSLVIDQSQLILNLIIFGIIAVTLIGGGMRSLTWSQCAQFIVVIIGILVPIIIIAVQKTNIPIPQLTYGTIFDNIISLERSSGINNVEPSTIKQAIPTNLPAYLSKPTLQSFGALSMLQFSLVMICFALGAACLPAVLSRMSTTPTVSEARKSAAWGVALLGLIIISAPSYALFTKLVLFDNLQQYTLDQLPAWVTQFQQNGIFAFGNTDKTFIDMKSLAISRDGTLFLLPAAANFPFILYLSTICVVILAALAAASAQIIIISNMISHDLIYSISSSRLSETSQVNTSRISILLLILAMLLLSLSTQIDSFTMLIYAFSMLGASIFPSLTVSIWWKKCHKSAVMFGMLSGLATSIAIIFLSEQGISLFGIEATTASIIGAPVNLFVTILVNAMSSDTVDIKNSIIDDTRIPGGETIYDRFIRNKIRKQQKALALES